MLAYLKEIGLDTPLLEHRIEQAWPEVMGETVARYTREAKVRGGMLYVSVTSAPLRQNLIMEHQSLAKRLNEHVGANVITDVHVM